MADVSEDVALRGYADILRLITDHADEIPFTESQIKYFHSVLLRHDPRAASHRRMYRQSALEFPTSTSWGLGATSAVDAPASEMGRLVQWTQQVLENGDVHPLIAIALFLYRFLVLRPFVDANGRLALALTSFLLDHSGYSHVRIVSLEELLVEKRTLCAEALRQSQHGAGDREDATSWVLFFLDFVWSSIDRALETLGPEAPAIRLHPRLHRLLDTMETRRSAKIGDILNEIGSPRATLKRDLKELVNAGYLTSLGVRKGTVYHFVQRPRERA